MNIFQMVNLPHRLPWRTGQSAGTLRRAIEKLEKPCRLFRRNRRAAAAVEFAVILPVFFLLIFGMIEYGRMIMVQQVITNAAREGARLAVLDGTSHNEVKDRVEAYLTSSSIDKTHAQVDIYANGTAALESAGFGDPITVSVSIPFTEVSWLPSPMYLGGKTLTAKTVMRREAVQ
jgi:Flp pilus assembly protein TadG